MLDALLDVVSVHEQDAILRKRLRIGAKCFYLAIERHDPRMGMRAGDRDIEHFAREHVRRGSAAPHHRSAARPQRAACSLGTTKTELRHRGLGGKTDTRRLRRDERLEIHAAQKSRLEQLALQDGTCDAHNGFHGKNHRAFAHRVHVKRQPHLA